MPHEGSKEVRKILTASTDLPTEPSGGEEENEGPDIV
jgi:hypothetical protein